MKDNQIHAIATLTHLLEDQQIDYWLFGGWAVDFHAGRVTRAHADIDIAIWLADLDRLKTALRQEDWIHTPEPGEDGYTVFQNNLVRLDLAFLSSEQGTGVIYTPLQNGRGDWPEGSFGDDVAHIETVRAHVVSLASLVADKSEVRDQPSTEAKDRADVAVLRALETDGGPVPS